MGDKKKASAVENQSLAVARPCVEDLRRKTDLFWAYLVATLAKRLDALSEESKWADRTLRWTELPSLPDTAKPPMPAT
ncbi:hypothetical protein [Rhizobium tumorigenes]|uniref:hypothetical protein n=1 Tax=Rhizobium tumorigenes TaxID=2041385 RepID=UPI002420233B|nr:hypothetical protein [Rhizobium tumorigenes]WFS00612.1 hypothetical protein PR016_16025 [Rhizobium tumorigenes]